ncbi:hypothetical protein EDD27_5559 [Nonomuraea polychroma]|uniref:Uncharacterized protein n=1 Tax=Nonomuraea polychroma TaxID=46176 RepID=A0A438MB00_9ACTN|nr:hypothetical protein EDD27_5559 [Nonomuraea polychroma]
MDPVARRRTWAAFRVVLVATLVVGLLIGALW